MRKPHKRGSKNSTVTVKPFSYQPSKAELAEDARIDATPDSLAEAVLRPVKIVEDPDA